MKIAPRLVLEPYIVCRAAAIAGSVPGLLFHFLRDGNLQVRIHPEDRRWQTDKGIWQSGGNGAWETLSTFLSAGRVVIFFSFFFFFLVSYLFPERCSLGDNWCNSWALFHQTGQVKIKIPKYWLLIIGKGKGGILKGCLEQEQVELSPFFKPSSRWEMCSHFYPSLCCSHCSERQ